MKTHRLLTILWVAVLFTASCTQGMEGDGLDSRSQDRSRPEVTTREVILTATAADTNPGTKSTRGTGGEFLWSPGDEINLFYGPTQGCGSLFTAQNDEPVATTTFRGMIEVVTGTTVGSTDLLFWGTYPYNQGNTCDGNSVSIFLQGEQTAVNNSWGEGALASVGKSQGLAMSFYNVVGGIKFYITEPGIRRIVLKGKNNEILAGRANVTMSNNVPTITSFQEGLKEITLLAPLDPALPAPEFAVTTSTDTTWYYITVPPVNFSNGFTLTLLKDATQGVKNYSARTISRNQFQPYGKAANDGAVWSEIPPQANQIRYTATASVDYYIPNGSNTGNVVVSNNWDSSTGEGLITFAAPITAVDNEAFCDAWALTSVTLPDGVLSIGREAFAYCEALATVNLPNSVTDIYGLAFAHCTSLESIHIPKLLGIGYPNPFSGCTNLCSFTGPDASADGKFLGFSWDDPTNTRLFSCALGAFKNQELILPEVITIGAEAFAGGEFTGTVTIPGSVTTIEENAFYGCSNLLTIILNRGSYDGWDSGNFEWPTLPTLGAGAFDTSGSSPCTIKIPGQYALGSGLENRTDWSGYLSQIIVYQADNEVWHSSVASTLADNTMAGPLYGSSDIETPLSLASWGGIRRSGLKGVEPAFSSSFPGAIYVDVYVDDIYVVGPNAFNTEKGAIVTHLSLPHSVEYIGKEAFKDDIALVAFPSDGYNIWKIDKDAFFGCTAMTGTISIFHSEFVNGGIPRCAIENGAFKGCIGIEEVTLYECAEIGGYAFEGCTALQCVNLDGGTVDFIGDQAFYGCVDLERVAPSIANAGNCLFGDFGRIGRSAFSYTALEVIDSRVVILADYAFAGMNIQSAYVGGSEAYPTSVGKWAFANCSYLEEVNIPYVSGNLGANVFSGCSQLENITLGVTSIPDEYFQGFTSLVSVSLPKATSLGESAFKDCTGLESISIPQVTTLGANCFKGMHKLSSLSLPAVTTIGAGALGNGIRLSQVTIGPNISSLEISLFTQYENSQTKPASFNLTMLKSDPPAITNNTFSRLVLNPTSLPSGTSPLTITLANRLVGNSYYEAWKGYTPFSTLLGQGIQPGAIFVLAH